MRPWRPGLGYQMRKQRYDDLHIGTQPDPPASVLAVSKLCQLSGRRSDAVAVVTAGVVGALVDDRQRKVRPVPLDEGSPTP